MKCSKRMSRRLAHIGVESRPVQAGCRRYEGACRVHVNVKQFHLPACERRTGEPVSRSVSHVDIVTPPAPFHTRMHNRQTG